MNKKGGNQSKRVCVSTKRKVSLGGEGYFE